MSDDFVPGIGFVPPRTACPNTPWQRTPSIIAALPALYGVQAVFVVVLLGLGFSRATAVETAVGLLVADLAATAGRQSSST